MADFKVDLKTRIIDSETNVYLARAGMKGHLFPQVAAHNAIGPDLPNLGLNLRTDFGDKGRLEDKIKRARALASWVRTADSTRGPRPPRTLAAFESRSKGPGYAQVEGVVRGYFQTVNAGDLFVIPNPLYFGNAIIAEALPTSAGIAQIPGIERFDRYVFDGRKFDHAREVKMSDLPRSVVDLAQVPTGFAQIYDTRVKRRIFDLCYDDYVFDDQFASRIITTKKDFRPFDNNVLSSFMTMVAENIDRLQLTGSPLVSLEKAAFIELDDEDLQVKININSPGHLSVQARTIAPLVIATILAVLVSVDFNPSAIANDTSVIVGNSRIMGLDDLCSQEVARLSQDMLRFFSAENDFSRTCSLLKEAHSNTGAHSNVDVKVVP